MDMEFDKSLLKVHINYNNFPAKLWCLTNDPQNSSVFWSPGGESLVVDQQRFENELLSPVKQEAKLFKTTNFTSFIRQLNLYGFRKLYDGSSKDRHRNLHHFQNPYFKQGRPELLVHLKRLTISNKAKIQAGEEVTCRPPSRVHQQPQNSTNTEKTVCQCCSAGFMEADRTGGDQMPYAHYAYYPQNYSVSHHHNSIQTANWAAHSSAESQRGDVNLDRVFQMVDEFQGLPNVHIVRVGTPVKHQHTSSSPHTLPAGSDSPHSSRSQTAASSPSVSVCGVSVKLEPEGHELESQGVDQLNENDSTSLESSQKAATDQKLTAEQAS